ncbi:uncharacterized protein [Euphorbia lathyris]|uniref:uncharacterized protein n=1 Tax=Euphorbia lathyris TaxID=212925 RepID=UPI0033138E57
MEEEKAISYYDELTRKGEGAARFKQGLGFSTNNTSAPSKGSALASHSSFLSNFVKSSSTPSQTSIFEKQAQLQSIQNKLKKKSRDEPSSTKVSERNSSDSRHHPKRSRSRSRSREKYRDRRGNRSRSRSPSSRRDRRAERRKHSRSSSPRRRRTDDSKSRDVDQKRGGKERKGEGDFAQLIPGYEKMTPAERVKARMKFQLDETAENDSNKGMVSGWERFEFDKDAPLDDEEIEAVEDDVAVVKHIGQSFRFSAVEARKEEKIKAAHDEAMFGAPALPGSTISDSEPEADNSKKESNETQVAAGLLSEKVLAKQQGSWRDRARKA